MEISAAVSIGHRYANAKLTDFKKYVEIEKQQSKCSAAPRSEGSSRLESRKSTKSENRNIAAADLTEIREHIPTP